MKTAQLRQAFIDFFSRQGHTHVSSSSLVPKDDPSLLFTNAGMVQFKRTFLGLEKRDYQRAVSAQRCIRAGGKHNDLDNVGYTARHHTFFEMLGNFSFGDYFKKQAIVYAWTFLTDVLQLPPEKLWVTVFRDDTEARDIWLQDIGIDPQRFSHCDEKDNFWSMGDTGPCGPCSEIFYDHGPSVEGGPPGSEKADGDRYVEIWNLVFMQYDRDTQGILTPLPKPSVDTGMGLERIAAVMQGVSNNFDIDLFQHLINRLRQLAPTADPALPSFQVIVDHIRSCAFLIADGVLPSNEGRGYVLRRIIRRAVRHGRRLGLVDQLFFYELVPTLVEIMGDAYPALIEQKARIATVLKNEETQFLQTLSHGIHAFDQAVQHCQDKRISGDVAFKLYDTFGFPLDLTLDMARERQYIVDVAGFEQAMQRQRQQSQQSNKFAFTDKQQVTIEASSKFIGYEACKTETTVIGLLDAEQQQTEQLTPDSTSAGIILASTPFYAESGGQVGDTGFLKAHDVLFEVVDTQKSGKVIVHWGKLLKGHIHLGEPLQAEIDQQRRQYIRCHHSATHLIHAALRRVLGDHVQQMGSLVSADRARFDFLHPQPLTHDEWCRIEDLVNDQIRQNHIVDTTTMSIDAAKTTGAIALFGEKYDDNVRVLTMGDFSKELCGGTHVARTGDIGMCLLLSECGVASGVRRLEFVAGEKALIQYRLLFERQSSFASQLKVSIEQLPEKLQSIQEQQKVLEKTIEHLKQQQAMYLIEELVNNTKYYGETAVLTAALKAIEIPVLRQMVDVAKSHFKQSVIVLASLSSDNQRLQVIASVSRSLIDVGLDARSLVQSICGKGGGRPDMAQGGGVLTDNFEQHFTAVCKQIPQMLLPKKK